jgi:hypothetical protein
LSPRAAALLVAVVQWFADEDGADWLVTKVI